MVSWKEGPSSFISMRGSLPGTHLLGQQAGFLSPQSGHTRGRQTSSSLLPDFCMRSRYLLNKTCFDLTRMPIADPKLSVQIAEAVSKLWHKLTESFGLGLAVRLTWHGHQRKSIKVWFSKEQCITAAPFCIGAFAGHGRVWPSLHKT